MEQSVAHAEEVIIKLRAENERLRAINTELLAALDAVQRALTAWDVAEIARAAIARANGLGPLSRPRS